MCPGVSTLVYSLYDALMDWSRQHSAQQQSIFVRRPQNDPKSTHAWPFQCFIL